jgi:hypothetical protein
MPLATYTAVLLSNSAVPVWFAARRTLPLLFGVSSAASLVSVFDLMPLGDRERTIVRRFGIAGRVGELAASHAVEHDACVNPRMGFATMHGVSGALWKAAKVLTESSLVFTLIPGKSKAQRTAAGVCGVLGGLAALAVFPCRQGFDAGSGWADNRTVH